MPETGIQKDRMVVVRESPILANNRVDCLFFAHEMSGFLIESNLEIESTRWDARLSITFAVRAFEL
jgi:hypothetical protein